MKKSRDNRASYFVGAGGVVRGSKGWGNEKLLKSRSVSSKSAGATFSSGQKTQVGDERL